MQKVLVFIAVGLAACVAIAAVVLHTPPPAATVADPVATADDRIRALEAAVGEERAARQLLEEQLLMLYAEIDRLDADRQQRSETRDTRVIEPVDSGEQVEQSRQFRAERAARSRQDALLEAGFAPDRVAWIVRREEELQYAAMQARFEARSSGAPLNPFDAALNPDALLRAELGDAEYERYLVANSRSTSVAVASVLASSPAASAGLQPGDQIIAYNGQRVFNGGDLMQQTMTSGTGNVVVDVVRDGMPLQIVVPHGPIGVEMGRFRGR
jgi:hypothetical protein